MQYRKFSKERKKNALENFQLKNSFSQCRNQVKRNTMYRNGNVCLFGRVRDQDAHVNVLWKQGVWHCVISHQFDRSCCLIPILSPTHWGRFLAGQQSGDTGSSRQETLDLIMASSSRVPCQSVSVRVLATCVPVQCLGEQLLKWWMPLFFRKCLLPCECWDSPGPHY